MPSERGVSASCNLHLPRFASFGVNGAAFTAFGNIMLFGSEVVPLISGKVGVKDGESILSLFLRLMVHIS